MAETGSERTGPRESKSTAALSGQGGSREGESTHGVAEHCGPRASQGSETTDQVAQHGGSIEQISGYGGFTLRVGGIVYHTPFEGASNEMTYNTTTSEVVGRRLGNEDLGPLVAEATREATKESTDLTTTSRSPTSDEVPVYSVEGYDPSFRLAACLGDRLIMFETLSNPKVYEASDLLDIGGKVSTIDITSMDRVRDLVAAGGASVVLAQDRDRFARGTAYHYLLRREFEEQGTRLRTLNDRGDDSPEGELTDGMLDQLAKFERAKTAERTRRGRLRKAWEGKVVAGRSPRYGFKVNASRDGY